MQDIIRGAYNKIRNMLARGIVQLIKDSNGVQLAQVTLMADEVSDDLDHPQEYGFTSLAPANSECLAAFFGGEREHGTIITVYNRSARPKTILQVGDAMIYDNRGNKIWIKNGEILIEHATKITIKAPLTEVQGSLKVTGTIEATGQISSAADIIDNTGSNPKTMSQMRSIYNSHQHQEHDGPDTSSPNNSM